MNRLEHAVPAGIIMIAGLIVAYISFTQQPAEAFVFPRLISVVFVALSVFVFVQRTTDTTRDWRAQLHKRRAPAWHRRIPLPARQWRDRVPTVRRRRLLRPGPDRNLVERQQLR